MTEISKYSSTELQILIDSEVTFPQRINELDFQHQIKPNLKVRWHVNPFLLEEDCLRVLLDANHFNKWRAVPRVGQIISTFFAYWCIRTWTVEMLILLPIFPFTIVALSRSLFVFCVGGVIAAKLYYNLTVPLFWVIIALTVTAFEFTKSADGLAKRLVIKQGLNDWETFWKYYSNHIIYLDWTNRNEEAQYLLQRYPELGDRKEKFIE